MIIFYLLQRFQTILGITLCHLHTVVFYVLLVWYYEMLCQKWRNKTVKSYIGFPSDIWKQNVHITRKYDIHIDMAMSEQYFVFQQRMHIQWDFIGYLFHKSINSYL